MNERDAGSAALTSRAMYWRLSSNLLILRAKNACRNVETAPTVLEKVFVAASHPNVGLTSEQRLAIIKSLEIKFFTGSLDAGNAEQVILAKFVTRKSATAVVEVVKGLRPEHKGEGLYYASKVLEADSGVLEAESGVLEADSGVLEADSDDHNLELFKGFAKIAIDITTKKTTDVATDVATSFKDDKNKWCAVHLLSFIHTIPESARLDHFDSLAPLSETIVIEKAKAGSIRKIAGAIPHLPEEKRNDRFVRYADATQSIKDDDAKAMAAGDLAGFCIPKIPEADRRNAFDKIVSIVRSINDASKDKGAVIGILRDDVIKTLPEGERSAARAILDSLT